MESEKISLSVSDVVSIMEAAHRSGVIELKFGPLHARFGQKPTLGEADMQNFGSPPAPAAEIAEKQRIEAEKSLLQAEIMSKEAQLAQMFIEDPEQAERMIAEGDLIDDGDRDDEET